MCNEMPLFGPLAIQGHCTEASSLTHGCEPGSISNSRFNEKTLKGRVFETVAWLQTCGPMSGTFQAPKVSSQTKGQLEYCSEPPCILPASLYPHFPSPSSSPFSDPEWHFKWALTQLHLRAKLPPSTNGKVRPAMDWLQLASTCNKIVYLFMCVRLYPIASDCLEHFSNEYVPSSRTSKRRPQFTKYIFPVGIIQSSQRSCHLSAWCVFKGVPFIRYWMHSPNIGAVSKHCLHVYPAHTVRTVTVISL